MTTIAPEAGNPQAGNAELRALLKQVDKGRHRKDRFMQGLVYVAFLLAVIPLVSVSWTVVSKGIERFNAYFLTHSMRGVYGGMDAGGIYPVSYTHLTLPTICSV